jgi:hypothetical protein
MCLLQQYVSSVSMNCAVILQSCKLIH